MMRVGRLRSTARIGSTSTHVRGDSNETATLITASQVIRNVRTD